MTAQVTVVSVPAPCEFLSANDRLHWAHKARIVRQWREAACWAFKAAKIQPFTQQVHITAVIHKPHGRRYDAANFYPTCKAAIDGGTDAGAWSDDDNDHVIGPDMRRGAADKVNPRLTLEIRAVGAIAAWALDGRLKP